MARAKTVSCVQNMMRIREGLRARGYRGHFKFWKKSFSLLYEIKARCGYICNLTEYSQIYWYLCGHLEMSWNFKLILCRDTRED